VVNWASDVTVANGACEYTARWLERGDLLRWSVSLSAGSDVRVFAYWVTRPRDAHAKVSAELLVDSVIATGEACEGSHRASEDDGGVLWLCADNVASWWYEKTIQATLTVEKAVEEVAQSRLTIAGYRILNE